MTLHLYAGLPITTPLQSPNKVAIAEHNKKESPPLMLVHLCWRALTSEEHTANIYSYSADPSVMTLLVKQKVICLTSTPIHELKRIYPQLDAIEKLTISFTERVNFNNLNTESISCFLQKAQKIENVITHKMNI
jgi:hypothetical protein